MVLYTMLQHKGRLEHINCVNASRHYCYLLLSLPETYGENANVPMYDYSLLPIIFLIHSHNPNVPIPSFLGSQLMKAQLSGQSLQRSTESIKSRTLQQM